MNDRLKTLIGGVAAVTGVAGVGLARAQENEGGTVTLGDAISGRVEEAVAPIATSGGDSESSEELVFDDSSGTAIADASGGNNNISFVS